MPQTQTAATTTSGADAARYLITFAYLPDEASWCVCRTFAAVAAKARELWDVKECALVFYLTSHAGKATAVKVTCEEDFELWYRGGRPVTGKLIVHDRDRALSVTHSSGFAQMSHRPLLDALTLQDLGAHSYLRHPAVDEVILIGEAELTVWGRAVQKAQATWKVHRPLFRYVDDVQGERVVVSILDSEDYSMWNTHRRPLVPELTVFEHAAPQLLAEPLAYSQSPPAGCGVPEAQQHRAASSASAGGDAAASEAAAKAEVVRAPYRLPPELHNSDSAEALHERATGRPNPKSKAAPTSEGELAFQQLQRALERKAEVAAAARRKPTGAGTSDDGTAASS